MALRSCSLSSFHFGTLFYLIGLASSLVATFEGTPAFFKGGLAEAILGLRFCCVECYDC